MNNDDLGTLLREQDPAVGKSLTAEQKFAMRRSVLAAVKDRSRRAMWRPALALVVVVGIAIAALILNRTDSIEPEAVAVTQTAEVINDGAQPEPAPTHVRQIQYTTEGGTRVFWTLDPDFDL